MTSSVNKSFAESSALQFFLIDLMREKSCQRIAMKITCIEIYFIVPFSRMKYCMKLVKKCRRNLFEVSKLVRRNHRLQCYPLSFLLYRMELVGNNSVKSMKRKTFLNMIFLKFQK